MIPKRYLIATLFIAAMLLIVAVVQSSRSAQEGGASAGDVPVALALESFETLAELRMEEGWAPRLQGAQDPDQMEPWPYGGGFGTPWEPPSAYLDDRALALNGPGGRSEVALWHGLEWRHYRFDAPLASARLDGLKGTRLLVTLELGPLRFETRLLEIPEGRVLWAVDSGPWSRFSWDGRAALVGLAAPAPGNALLLASLPLDVDIPEPTLAPWDEKEGPAPQRGWAVKPEQLWDDGQDLPGARVLVPWPAGARLWFPRWDVLWVAGGNQWTCWQLKGGVWHRQAAGLGTLAAHPPQGMSRTLPSKGSETLREISPLDRVDWHPVPPGADPWPAYDPAWAWRGDGSATTAWDLRWGKEKETLAPERQRDALAKAFRPDWRTAYGLRASVKGWLPQGPEVALREGQGVAWVWVGDRVLLVRLQPSSRSRALKDLLTTH